MSTPHPPYRPLLGSCPDSWGVWFADDPRQTPWSRFLDELAEAGYRYLELGPYGYLPTDPARLRDEVGRRGLTVAGGTVAGHSGLHKPGDFGAILAETRRVAELTAALGARHCEPPYGLPDIPPVLAALDGLGAELFTVVEQDMYPCDFGKPKPIAARTYGYLNSHGLGGHDGGAA
jgi:sugar phosphate isomerase/epimerase